MVPENEVQIMRHSLFMEPLCFYKLKRVEENYPAFVVFPQCPKDDTWSNTQLTEGDFGNLYGFQEEGKPTKAMMALLEGLVKRPAKNP